MFNKIIQSFRGKKPEETRATPAHSVDPTEQQTPDDYITVCDSYGRPVRITRTEWKDNLLMPNIQKAWHDADALYGFILQALQDNFIPEMIGAAAQLVTIDTNIERSHTIQAIIQLETGSLDEAETTLQHAIEHIGETGILLTNMAKIHDLRAETAARDATLWHALELDPNQENGLGWWLALQRETLDTEHYQAALQRISALPDSWRAQLWQARTHLEQAEYSQAKALYRQILPRASQHDDALMMMAHDLSAHQQPAWVIDLVAPYWNPDQQNPQIGLHVLQAYLTQEQVFPAEALLHQLYALEIPHLKNQLDQLANQLQQLKHALDAAENHAPVNPLSIEIMELEKPVWSYGLHAPDWLFTAKKEAAPIISFFSFFKQSTTSTKPETQQEDELGRLSRSIPLYLAESIHYWTDYQANTLFPVVPDQGAVIFGASGADPSICAQFKGNSRYFVTGEIAEQEQDWTITARLYDCTNDTCIWEEIIPATTADIGSSVLKLEFKLLDQVKLRRTYPQDDFYERPSPDAMTTYLTALGQNLMLSLVANELLTPSRLWGERNMLEWPLQMALHWPQATVPKLMYIAALAKAASYQSPIVPEFKHRTLQLLKDSQHQKQTIGQLEPLVWQIFCMNTELANAISAQDSTIYAQWLRDLQVAVH